MKGNTLRLILEAYNIKQSELAKSLGIKPQALYSKLKSKDLKESFIDDIANATRIPKWLFLNPPGGAALKFVLNKYGYNIEQLSEKGLFSKEQLEEIFRKDKIYSDDLYKLNSIVDIPLDKLTLPFMGIGGTVGMKHDLPDELRNILELTQYQTPSLAQPTTSLTSETLLLDLLQRVQRLERQVELLQEKVEVSADAGTPGNATGTYGI